jgi:peptidoglycan/LPS O-acetylase OafA/YrhL
VAETRHYPALDGLRGVAALAVVSLHVTGDFRLPVQLGHAYLAVDFFFMLSGFVIAHAYDARLRSGLGLGRFLAIRLIRLQPLVLLGVTLGASAYLLHGSVGIANVLDAATANALLLPTPALLAVRPYAFPTDTPLWSLAFEIWINLLYALAFPMLTRRVLGLVLGLSAGLLLAVALTHGGLNIGFPWRDFYLGGARVLFPFTMGVMLSRYANGSIARLAWAHTLSVPLLLVLCAPSFGGGWFDAVAVLLFFPAVLHTAARATTSRRLDPLWGWLGRLSYPIYVVHYPLVAAVSNLFKAAHAGPAANWAGAGGTMLLVLVAAALAETVYDAPVRAWLARRMVVPARVGYGGIGD